MKLPDTAHTSRPWRIHELTPDFRLEDVWALPTPGGPDDLARLVEQFAGVDDPQALDADGRFVGEGDGFRAGVSRALFALRWQLGAVVRLGRPPVRSDTARPAARRPARDARAGPRSVPFSSLYLTHDEWAAEIVNRTAHAVMHIGWVPDGAGGYRGQMAVLVKPNGLLRRGLHGRDRAVPAPDRLPGADPEHRAALAGGRLSLARPPRSAQCTAKGRRGECAPRRPTPPGSVAADPHRSATLAACGRTRSRPPGAWSASEAPVPEAGRDACSCGCEPAGSAARTCRRSSGGATRSSTPSASRATRCTRWSGVDRGGHADRRLGRGPQGPRRVLRRARGRDRRARRRADRRRGDGDPAAVHGAAPARPGRRRRQARRGDRAGADRAAVQPRAARRAGRRT